MSIVIWILTFFLVLASSFLILIVLAQKAKSDGGMGSAMGGGMAEAAFGAETSNVLSKSTIYAAIAFFVLALLLYLTRLHQQKHGTVTGGLPTIPVSTAPALPPAGTPPVSALTIPVAPASTAPASMPAPVTATPDAAKKP
jgi:preprotein translocase subunit SecG